MGARGRAQRRSHRPGSREPPPRRPAPPASGIVGQGSGYMLETDANQTGVFTSIAFRPMHVTDSGPWWLSLGGATTTWFDTGADNPYDPRNYGGGYTYTSTEQDTVIIGD